MNLVIVDYGLGNIGSIINMFKHIGISAIYTYDKEKILSADKLLLPGVGAFDNGMIHLKKSGLIPILEKKVLDEKTPLLGICLGMQLLLEKSEEGSEPGLGWIKGSVKHFQSFSKNIRIPHIGWNHVYPKHTNSLYANLVLPKFYFVHSYYASVANEDNILSVTHYGQNFVSSVQKANIFGTQYHPEKSHKYGIQLLRNFIEKV